MTFTIPQGYSGRGLLANRPAAGIAGATWVVTDNGLQRLTIDDGAAWHDVTVDSTWAPGGGGGGLASPFTTPPAAAAFTWDSQGTAVRGDGIYGPFLHCNSGGAGIHSLWIPHTPPKTLTAAVKLGSGRNNGNGYCGIAVRSGGLGGKVLLWGLYGGHNDIVAYYSAPGTEASDPYLPGGDYQMFNGVDIWLRIVDDNTNLSFQSSADEGNSWETQYTETRAAHLGVPDAYGLSLTPNGNNQLTTVYLKSWSVA